MAATLTNYNFDSSTRPSGPLSPTGSFPRHGILDVPRSAADPAVSLVSPVATATTTAPPKYEETDTLRSVRFSPMNHVQDTISRHDMSPEEHENCWLQAHELRNLKRRSRRRHNESNKKFEEEEDDDDDEDESSTARSRGDSKGKDKNDDLSLPALESDRSRKSSKPQSNRSVPLVEYEKLYSAMYDLDGTEDPFAEVCFEVVGEC